MLNLGAHASTGVGYDVNAKYLLPEFGDPRNPPSFPAAQAIAFHFIDYVVHGLTYVLFSRMQRFEWALVFIFLSRAAMAVNSVLNYSYLLKAVSNQYRGRVFSTIETLTWTMMMLSMMGAGIASVHYSPRVIGTVAGLLSSTTAVFWGWANWSGRLPLPEACGVEMEEVEIYGDPVV